MNKFVVLLIIVLLPNICLYGQSANKKSKLFSTIESVAGGLFETAEWYDIPIAAAYFTRKLHIKSPMNNMIDVPASSFEKNLSNSVGDNSRSSFGSIDQDYFPNIVFWARFATAFTLGSFTETKICKETFRDIFLFKKAVVYTYTLTEYTKTIFNRERPNKIDRRSFFSGHTSTTFATSTYLFLELNGVFENWSLTRKNKTLKTVFNLSAFSLLYGWAGYVGYSRMLDNKHYITDVIVGATVGTLMSVLVYNIYHSEDEEETMLDNFSLMPGGNSSLNLSFSLKF